MESLHKQEKVLQNFQFDGASAQLVEWTETLWCGKVKYAPNCTDEPDVEKLMEEFVALGEAELSPVDPEEGWDVCLSINYLSNQRPSGVFFGFHVEGRRQPEGFDLLYSPELGARLVRDFRQLKPLYAFFLKTQRLSFEQAQERQEREQTPLPRAPKQQFDW